MSVVPVVVATNGFGMPVRVVESGAPLLTVAANGMGMPIVISDRGAPFVVQGLDWTPENLFSGDLSGHWAGGYAPEPFSPALLFPTDGAGYWSGSVAPDLS